MRIYKIFRPTIFLLTLLSLPGCTLYSVGSMVKNGFGKGVMKGDPKKAAQNATPGFAKVINSFTPKQFKLLLALGTGNGKSGKSKKNKLKYHSFSSSGDTALLVMKQGATRLKFRCKRVHGEWRVDDMVITGKKTRLSLREVMGIFRAALKLFSGLTRGEAALAYLDGDLKPALKKVAPDLSPFVRQLAKAFADSTEKTKKTPKKSSTKGLIEGFAIKTDSTGGTLHLLVSGVKITIELTRFRDVWRFSSIKADLPNREPLYLSSLLRIGAPWLALYAHRAQLTTSAILQQRLLDLMEPALAAKLGPFVRFGITWAQSNLATAKKQKKSGKKQRGISGGLSLALLNAVTWNEKIDSFTINYKETKVQAQAVFSRDGLIRDVRVRWKKLTVTPSDLAGFIPLVHFLERGIKGLDTPAERARFVKEAVGFLHKPLREGVEQGLPATITLPLNEIFRVALARFGGSEEQGRAMPHISFSEALKGFSVTSLDGGRKLEVLVPLGDAPSRIVFVKEEGLWKIASFVHKGEELLTYATLLPSLLRFIEGAVTLNANMVADSFGDTLGGNLREGLVQLFKLHGKRMKRLGTEVTMLTMARLMENRDDKASEKQKGAVKERGREFTLPTLVKSGDRIRVTGRSYSLSFAKKSDGTYGFDFPLCQEPVVAKGAKKRRSSRGKSLCFNGVARQEPLQLLELIPVGVGYFYGLALTDYRSLRAFSAPSFNKKVWKKLPPEKLAKIMRKYKVEIRLPKAAEVVDMIMLPMGKAETAAKGKPKSSKNVQLRGRGYIIRRDHRYPFAELWLNASGKEVDLAFTWDKKRKQWLLYDIKVKVRFLGKVSIAKLVNAL